MPLAQRGTYAGAALKASYLAGLGVTAVEFLPVQETQNDQNDIDPNSDSGDNYWGYMTLNYFAPDRRYSSDKTAGGRVVYAWARGTLAGPQAGEESPVRFDGKAEAFVGPGGPLVGCAWLSFRGKRVSGGGLVLA